MPRKDMRGVTKHPQPPFLFRTVVNNGTSRGLNLTELLKDWEQVRITVLEDKDNAVTILIENVMGLKV